MKKQEIIDAVNVVMADKAGINASGIKPEDYYDEIGVDEGAFIDAVVKIEDEFAIDIPSEKLIHVSTMQQLYDLVGQIIVDTHGFQLFD